MPITTTTTRTNGQRASNGARPAPAALAAGRRRQVPLVVVGVLLVIGCALAFADASLHLGSREEVLVVAQPLAAGQVLTAGDLRAAQGLDRERPGGRPGRRGVDRGGPAAWRCRWWRGRCSPPPRSGRRRRSGRARTWWRSA